MEQLSSPLEQYLKTQGLSDPQIIKAINAYEMIGEYTYCSELMRLVQQILLDPDDIKVQTQLVNQLRNTKITYEQKLALQSTIIKESHQNSQMIQIASDTYQLQSQQLLEQNKILNEKLKQVSKQLLKYQKSVMDGLSTLDNSAIQESKGTPVLSMFSHSDSTKIPTDIQEVQLELMSLSKMAGVKTSADEPLIQTIKQLQYQVQSLKQQNTQYEAQIIENNAKTMTGEPLTNDEQFNNMRKLIESQNIQLQSYKQMEAQYAKQKILLDEAVKKASILEQQRNEQYELISELQGQVASSQQQLLYVSEDGGNKTSHAGGNSEEMIQTQNLTMSSDNATSNLYTSNRQLQQEHEKLQIQYNQLFDDMKMQQELIKELQTSNLQLEAKAKEYLDVINLQNAEMNQKIKECDNKSNDQLKIKDELQISQQEQSQMQDKIDSLIAMDQQNSNIQTQQNDLLIQYRKQIADLQQQLRKYQQKLYKLKKGKYSDQKIENNIDNQNIIEKYNKICQIYQMSSDPTNNHVDEIIAKDVEEKEKIEKLVIELKELICDQQEEEQYEKPTCIQTLELIKNELDKVFQSTTKSQESPCVIERTVSERQSNEQNILEQQEENDTPQSETEKQHIINNLNNKINQLQDELQILVAQFNKSNVNDDNIYVKFYSKNDVCIYNSIFPTFDQLKEKIQNLIKQFKENHILNKDFYKIVEMLYSQIKDIILDEEIRKSYNINFDNVHQSDQREFLIKNQLKCYYNYGTEQYFQIFFATQLESMLNKCGIEKVGSKQSELYIEMLIIILQLVLDNCEVVQMSEQEEQDENCIIFPAFVKKSYLGNNVSCISAIQCPVDEM